jgi:hypothetical protein
MSSAMATNPGNGSEHCGNQVPTLPRPEFRSKDVMRLVRNICGPSGKNKIGGNFDKLPAQLKTLRCGLRMIDLEWTLQSPEKRTVEVWNHTYSDWTGVDMSQLERDQVVPVIPHLGQRANAMVWAAMNGILSEAYLQHCENSYGEDPQMHQVWSFLSRQAGHVRISM